MFTALKVLGLNMLLLRSKAFEVNMTTFAQGIFCGSLISQRH